MKVLKFAQCANVLAAAIRASGEDLDEDIGCKVAEMHTIERRIKEIDRK